MRQQLKTWCLMNFQCMIMYQQDKDEVTAYKCIFIFFYFRKLIIVEVNYCTLQKQLVSILQAGVKGVHVTNNIQYRDSCCYLYGIYGKTRFPYENDTEQYSGIPYKKVFIRINSYKYYLHITHNQLSVTSTKL
ncbi:Hypothetical_protein [Hexamita inflata]|uniref:Hypothetical_protein n=1 Tax=Hexamita inflata TaxID=28002 RepID=A0AA86Q594_9EUKA|nr:Hypothetical protein HINF_LOCUS40235 [Hexamita inflata]